MRCAGSVLLVGLAACGASSATTGAMFVGTYQVTAHHANMMQGTTVACSDPGPSVTDGPPDFALVVDPFFDDPDVIKMQTCTAPGACMDTLDTFMPAVGGLVEVSSNTQTGGGAICNLYAGRGTVALAGGVAHVEVRSWFASLDSASDCTLAHADALRTTPDCETVETWDGTKLP